VIGRNVAAYRQYTDHFNAKLDGEQSAYQVADVTCLLGGLVMSQIAVNAELHFHEQEVLSIFHETNVTGTEELFAELVFASAFAIRSMSNLGTHEVTDALAQQLQVLARMIVELPDQLLVPMPRLIQYPGYQGRKYFVSRLRLTNNQLQLHYTAKGFGWLATGVGYYCPAAVQSLFRYFAHRRLSDSLYRNTLANVAAVCGELQIARQISLTNQPQLVMGLAAVCMEHYMPEWMK